MNHTQRKFAVLGMPTECTVIDSEGEECRRPVAQDAPISICGPHMRQAYSYCEDQIERADPSHLAALQQLPRLSRQQLIARIREARAVVYYALTDGYIKIGTTVHLAQRMKQLGANLVAVEPGSYELEAERHEQFAGLRVGNTEHFKPGKALIAHIAALQAS